MTATKQNDGAEISPYPKLKAGVRWHSPIVSHLDAHNVTVESKTLPHELHA